MKYKVSELEGALLDAAVAKAEGIELIDGTQDYPQAWDTDLGCWRGWSACRDWRIGGPIIEREQLSLQAIALGDGYGWEAGDLVAWSMTGPTLLIAAMRAYVDSKFGDEVEI